MLPYCGYSEHQGVFHDCKGTVEGYNRYAGRSSLRSIHTFLTALMYSSTKTVDAAWTVRILAVPWSIQLLATSIPDRRRLDSTKIVGVPKYIPLFQNCLTSCIWVGQHTLSWPDAELDWLTRLEPGSSIKLGLASYPGPHVERVRGPGDTWQNSRMCTVSITA